MSDLSLQMENNILHVRPRKYVNTMDHAPSTDHLRFQVSDGMWEAHKAFTIGQIKLR